MAKAQRIHEDTTSYIASQGINENDLYCLTDYPVGGITQAQMVAALTPAQEGFYLTNSVYMCIDEVQGGAYIKDHCYKFTPTAWIDVTPWGNHVQTTLANLEQAIIDNGTAYCITDYPIGGITNAQMAAALAQAQEGFYKVGSVYMCIDSGTYLVKHFYRFNGSQWVDVTPEFAGQILKRTLTQLEQETIDENALYSISDYPIGGITQAQMNAAITPEQLGFYQVGSVYLCTDSGNDYVQHHFYRFSYDSENDEYYWYDTKAGADIDDALSTTSTNPVQNRLVTNELNDKVSLTKNETVNGQKIFTTIPKYGEILVPSGYQQLEYITSTGGQYINLGIVPTANTKIEIKWKATNYSGNQAIIGCVWNSNAMLLNIQSSKWYFHANGVAATTPSTAEPELITYSAAANSFVVNGITYNNSADTLANVSSGLKLFGINASTNPAYGSLYYLKIYENDVLTHHYVPCINLSNNLVGIYDLIDNEFKANNGNGAFTIGKVNGINFATIEDVDTKVGLTGDELIYGEKTFTERPKLGNVRLPNQFTELEYIESTGTQYIDTGFNPTPSTELILELKFDGTFKNTATYGGSSNIFGAMTSGTSAFTINYGGQANEGNSLHNWVNIPYTGSNDEALSITDTIRTNRNMLTFKSGSIVYGTASRTLVTKTTTEATTLDIFGNNNSGTHSPFTAYNMYVYSCQIKNNGVLVRDYIPCYTNQAVTNSGTSYPANTIGLYDLVNNKFYANNGTGLFIKGNELLLGDEFATITDVNTKVGLTGNEVVNGLKQFIQRPIIGSTALLPNEFTQIEYIESTGTQYITIPVVFDDTDEVHVRFSVNLNNTNDKYIVSPTSWNANNNRFGMGVYNSNYTVAYGNSVTSATALTPTTANDGNPHDWTYYNHVFTITDLNVTKDVSAIPHGGTTDNLKLFKAYDGYTSGKLYRYTHNKNGEDVIDLIPCYTNQEVTNNGTTYLANVTGLYDLVNDIFYINNGSGEFLRGNDVLLGNPVALQNEIPQIEINNQEQTTATLNKLSLNGVNYKVDYAPYRITELSYDEQNIYITIV